MGKMLVLTALFVSGFASDIVRAQAFWYKGNTHTHTLNSDGDSTPDDVVRWYRKHGYDFLFITDHNMLTEVDSLNALFGGSGKFLVIRGEEVTSNYASIYVHVNALNPHYKIDAQQGNNQRETLQKNLNAVISAGALAQINHPNFFWQLSANDIAAIKNAQLLEIMNMHPIVNSFGAGPGAPSAEEIWDQVLSRGSRIWGVASDDEHELKESFREDPGDPGRGALPGRGWIVVRAQRLTVGDVMRAIEIGNFYSSTGVELEDYTADAKQISINIKSQDRFETKYRTEFIGKGGRVLKDEMANPAIYQFRGDEGYVRARVTDSNGKRAWTQPVFLNQ